MKYFLDMKKTKLKNNESERFRLFRKSENLTQKGMAEVLGKEQPTVQRYESGETFVPHDVIRLLNMKLGLSYNWFFNGSGPMKIDPSWNTQEYQEVWAEFAEELRTVRENMQRMDNLFTNQTPPIYTEVSKLDADSIVIGDKTIGELQSQNPTPEQVKAIEEFKGMFNSMKTDMEKLENLMKSLPKLGI